MGANDEREVERGGMNMKDGIYLGSSDNGVRPLWAVYAGRYSDGWPLMRGGSPLPLNAERHWLWVAPLPERFPEPPAKNAYVLLEGGFTARNQGPGGGGTCIWMVYTPDDRLEDQADLRMPTGRVWWSDIASHVIHIIWNGTETE